MSKDLKKVCTTLNYIKRSLILAAATNGCISISVFASLFDIPIGITSSAIGLKICLIDAGIKKYKSIISKRKTKYDKIVLLSKTKLNSIEVWISMALIDWNNSHDKFGLMNNVLVIYDDIKQEMKILKTYIVHRRFQSN